jgi:hypothetical protein
LGAIKLSIGRARSGSALYRIDDRVHDLRPIKEKEQIDE